MSKVMLQIFLVTLFVTLSFGFESADEDQLLSRYLSRSKRDADSRYLSRSIRDTDSKGTDLCNEERLTVVVGEHNACYKKAESQLTEAFSSGKVLLRIRLIQTDI